MALLAGFIAALARLGALFAHHREPFGHLKGLPKGPRGVQFEIEFGVILLQLLLAAHLFSCYWVLLGHYERPGPLLFKLRKPCEATDLGFGAMDRPLLWRAVLGGLLFLHLHLDEQLGLPFQGL